MVHPVIVAQGHRVKVDDVHHRFRGRIVLRQRADDQLQEVGLAGLGGAHDQGVRRSDVQGEGALMLVVRIVIDAQGQLEIPPGQLRDRIGERFRQRRHADGVEPDHLVVTAEPVHMRDHDIQLRLRLDRTAVLRLARRVDDLAAAPGVEAVNPGPGHLADAANKHLAAAVGRLQQGQLLVVAHLHIRPAGFLDFSGQGGLEHAGAVLAGLHAQAQPEVGVGPDLVIHDTGRLLGSQDQVHAQRTPDARRRDQLLHELGLLAFELGELVHDNDQVRQGHRHPGGVVLVRLDIVIDLVDVMLREQALSAQQLGLDGFERAVDLPPVDVGDGAQQMGQARKLVGHAAALEVDDQEAHLMRVKIERHVHHIAEQDLRLARAGGARHQAVRAIESLMQVQGDQLVFGLDAQAHRHGLCHTGSRPGAAHVKLIGAGNAQHFKEGIGFDQLALQADFRHFHRAQPRCNLPHHILGHGFVGEILVASRVRCVGKAGQVGLLVQVNDLAAAGRQELIIFAEEHKGKAILGRVFEVAGNRVVAQGRDIGDKQHMMHRPLSAICPAFGVLAAGQQFVDLLQVLVDAGLVIHQVADAAAPGIAVRQPPAPVKARQLLLLKQVIQTQIVIAVADHQVHGHHAHEMIQQFARAHHAQAAAGPQVRDDGRLLDGLVLARDNLGHVHEIILGILVFLA